MKKMMLGLRLVRLATAAWLIVAAAGCSSLYDEADNWVIENNDIPEYFAEYDVFYLYPSSHLSSRSLQNGDPAVHRANPDKYLNWLKDGVSEDLRRNVVLPLSRQFGPRVRLFSPLVPQVCKYTLPGVPDRFRSHGDLGEPVWLPQPPAWHD